MSEPTLIVPRRNFLIRALGFTAAGASMAVPVVALDSPRVRLRYHADGVQRAMQELWPERELIVSGNALLGGDVSYAMLCFGHPFER